MAAFSYIGYHRYSLTVCTRRNAPPLNSLALASELLSQLRQCAREGRFALLAYCFMPDHVHLLVHGLSEDADLRRFVTRWKQITGYWCRRQTGRFVWMPGYQDRVLRDGESTMDAVLYVLRNPVRKGLARRLGEYPFAGSDVYEANELQEVLRL